MSLEATKATAEKLLAHCRAHTEAEGLDELYAPDAVSVEAVAMAGTDSPESRGVEAIKGKHDWWDSAMEVHSEQKIEGPYLHGDDRFAVIFGFDATEPADRRAHADAGGRDLHRRRRRQDRARGVLLHDVRPAAQCTGPQRRLAASEVGCHGHFATGGSDISTASGLCPVSSPNFVPRS